MVEIITPSVLSTPGLLSSPRLCLGDDSRPGVDSTSGMIISTIILLSSQYLYTILRNNVLKVIIINCLFVFNRMFHTKTFGAMQGKKCVNWKGYRCHKAINTRPRCNESVMIGFVTPVAF